MSVRIFIVVTLLIVSSKCRKAPGIVPPVWDKCAKPCSFHYNLMCATNGVTYDNECVLEVKSCQNPAIVLLHEGHCNNTVPPVLGKCEKPCSPHTRPMCATNGVTYGDECSLKVKSCQNPAIVLVHEGYCQPEFPLVLDNCDLPCTLYYRPMCATDGVTYGNECDLDVASCKNNAIVLLHEGQCNNKVVARRPVQQKKKCWYGCPLNLSPVCASNGRTYGNSCFLEVANCDNTDIVFVKEGRCPKKAEAKP